MAVDDEVRVRRHRVEADGALDHTGRDRGKHPRGQLQAVAVFARPRRALDRVRIDDLPAGVVGNLEPGNAVDRKTVDLPGWRIGDEYREALRFELTRVDDLLPPERLAQDLNRQAQLLQ